MQLQDTVCFVRTKEMDPLSSYESSDSMKLIPLCFIECHFIANAKKSPPLIFRDCNSYLLSKSYETRKCTVPYNTEFKPDDPHSNHRSFESSELDTKFRQPCMRKIKHSFCHLFLKSH